jgi:hypothetical protein
LALGSSTGCAIFLLYNVLKLIFGYNYKYHRFAPGLVSPRDFLNTALLAVGFLCSAVLYRTLARSTEAKVSRSSSPDAVTGHLVRYIEKLKGGGSRIVGPIP